MVDDLEQRLGRYRADLDAAVAADLARRQLTGGEACADDADPFLFDIDHMMRMEPTTSDPADRRRVTLAATLGLAAAVATLVLVGVVVSRDGNDTTPTDQPAPTATVPPMTLPPVVLPDDSHPLVPGTYILDAVAQSTSPRFVVTVGAGWSSAGNFLSLSKVGDQDRDSGDSEGFIVVDRPDEVYFDACHWMEGYRPGGPETTVDGFVAALTEQKGWAEVTTPSDISIDGYAGKAFRRTAPTDISDCDTTTSLMTAESPRGVHPEFGGNAPGDIETIWVLDIDGTVVYVLTREFPETSAAARAEFAAVLDSIRIEQP